MAHLEKVKLRGLHPYWIMQKLLRILEAPAASGNACLTLTTEEIGTTIYHITIYHKTIIEMNPCLLTH